MNPARNRRILLIDDTPAIHDDFRKILAPAAASEALARLDVGDRLLILKKPFDAIEVAQLANTLCAKWQATQQAALKLASLEAAVARRTAGLSQSNAALLTEMAERRHLENQLETLGIVGGDQRVWIEVEESGSGIAQKHGGRLDVRSELGKGTCFRIELPVRQRATAAPSSPAGADKPS